MFKKFVVYLLFFSFALQLIPVERVSAAAANVIPTPAAHSFSYFYDKTNSVSQTKIRYQWGSGSTDYLDFKSSQMMGLSYMASSSPSSISYLNDYPVGTAGSWDAYIPDDIYYQNSGVKPYIMVHTDTYPNKIMNLCFSNGAASAGSLTQEHFYPLSYMQSTSATSPNMDDWNFGCKFDLLYSNDVRDTKTMTISHDPYTANSWGAYTSNGVNYDGNSVMQKLYNDLKSNAASGATVAVAKSTPPLSANVAACKVYAAEPLIATAADADKWIDAQLFQLNNVSNDANDKGVQYIRSLLANKGDFEQELIAYDQKAYRQFYGDTATPYTPYPTVKLTDDREGNLVTAKYQAIIDSLPFQYDPSLPNAKLWGVNPAFASNILLGVAAVALTTAGAVAIFNAAATGLVTAESTAALTPLTASATGIPAVAADGTVTIGTLSFPAGSAPAIAIQSSIGNGATAFTVTNGLIEGNGLAYPLIASDIIAAAVPDAAITVSTLAKVGTGVKLIAGWALKKTTVRVGLALGTALSFYKIYKQWEADNASAHTINPITKWMNNDDYKKAGKAYFKNLAQFALLHHYLTANNNYNKCLQSKNDPAASYNSAIQTKADSLLGDAMLSAGVFNNAPAQTDGCPNLSLNPFSKDSNKSLFGWIFCEINLTLYQIATTIARFALNVATYAIGVDST